MKKPGLLSSISALALPVTVLAVVPFCIIHGRVPSFTLPGHYIMLASGVIVFTCGLALSAWCVSLLFHTGNGTLAPWSPPENFVVTGPYLYTRNPMITGVITALAGEALALRSAGIVIWALLFCLINSLYFILSEEPGLERRFGKSYRDYRKNVPRWLIRATPYKPEK